ncbi:hypothetical protein [Lacticaseibacillus saniviri]|uniref:SAM-dependent methyltransferase n=1 Tax=Lacticaseibacillus saniviri JCM 17471 = DSM 24301 TaxID=1293598 RepID=A0A0R2MXR9_9LACO|nr:hypothetical protein [Lacticaseibacillus saniviri]KRO18201.1 SAM-dependent methyltransferase [Lacticaseibacillus saniviri JCM 17471 = DSM 24301]
MDYWKTLVPLAQKYAGWESVTEQLAAMTAVKTALAHNQLPKKGLPRLGLSSDTLMMASDLREAKQLDHLLRQFRFFIAYHYGMWAFVHQQLFATWQDQFGPLRYLEVAAGNGYISAGLQQAGNRVIATDAHTWLNENQTGHHPMLPVQSLGASAALLRYGHQVDAVVMAWSPDKDPNDMHFLRLLRREYPHLLFFVIGERFGATNSRLFWQSAQFVADRRLLPLNRDFKRFDAVNERIYLLA